jgi:hypothetical protein
MLFIRFGFTPYKVGKTHACKRNIAVSASLGPEIRKRNFPPWARDKTDANVFVYTARNFFRGIVMTRLGTALRPAATRNAAGIGRTG